MHLRLPIILATLMSPPLCGAATSLPTIDLIGYLNTGGRKKVE